MKIIGFGDKGLIKEALREAGIEPQSVRKVVTLLDVMEVYFHNGSPMQKFIITKSLIKTRRNNGL